MMFYLTFTHHLHPFFGGQWDGAPAGAPGVTRPLQELQKLRDEKLAAEKLRKAAEVPGRFSSGLVGTETLGYNMT